MRRGDVVTVSASGDHAKRPTVIVQTDALPAAHASVIVYQMKSDLSDALDFRVTIEPTGSTLKYSRVFEIKNPTVAVEQAAKLKDFYKIIDTDEPSEAVLKRLPH